MLSNRSLKSVIGVGGVLILLLIVGIVLLLLQKMKYTVYETDTLIEGNWVVASGEPVKLKNNAKITVTGNAVLNDRIVCEKGGLNLDVQGSLIVNKEFDCEQDPNEVGAENAGMNLVVKGHAVFSASSSLTSIGSVQLVDDASKLLTSQEQIDSAFGSVDSAETAPYQLGPLAEDGEDYTTASLNSSEKKTWLTSVHDQLIPPVGAFGIGTDVKITITEEQRKIIKEMQDLVQSNVIPSASDVAELENLFRQLAKTLDIELGENFNLSDISPELLAAILLIDTSEEPQEQLEFMDWFFKNALQAGETIVVVSGVVTIGDGGEPPAELDLNKKFGRNKKEQKKPKKVILNYDFSDGKGVALQNMTLNGLDGVHFGGITAPTCSHTGNDGGDAMRFVGRAGKMRIANFTINNGSGGYGETVVAPDDCDGATITGGKGGKPGNIRLVASREFVITGTFTIVPGDGGQGGGAKAVIEKDAKDGCNGEDGQAVVATGGDGGDSKQRLRARGVSGLGNVKIESAFAGDGGPAIANAGLAYGGAGEACKCNGGNGHNATAKGGDGGDTFSSAIRENYSGDGGDAEAFAGNGGDGGSCGQDEPTGGNGGNGGTAKATPGKGGVGDVNGVDGKVTSEVGGDGGFGGDGCLEGKKGVKGDGQTPGEDGEDGKRICTVEEKEDYQISVISWNGLLLPVFQLRVAGPDACDGDHWHGGPVKSISGEIANDPAPDACGFGKTSQAQPFPKAISHDNAVELYGDSVIPHLSPFGTNFDDGEGGMVEIAPRRTVIPF